MRGRTDGVTEGGLMGSLHNRRWFDGPDKLGELTPWLEGGELVVLG